jgi:uroporphyrinogen III methyltransferase/synthase
MKQGIVYLVGAGPGDYKLISVRGLEYIQAADTIVYDRLADERLLGHARPDVELIYVGKASSDHTLRQEEINQLLVDKAREGKKVVRLKGGDPFVFGRGGEEALELVAAGLPFEVVPGITSVISVPAYAGIPVTHRGIATSFAVITGHEDPTKPESTIRWDKLAQGTDTLVFLMGVENLPHITAKLIEHGRSPTTPAAVIRWGTKPEQAVLVTTVGEAAADVARQGIKPPAIFLAGEVVTLRDKLAWFDSKPLFGKTVLVTRAREQASLLTERLEALGAKCIEAPAIKIVPPASYDGLDRGIAELASYQWLIFTSVNGVGYFYKRLHQAGKDSRALAGLKIAAIGSQTAARLREFGVLADVVPVEFRAEGIIAALANDMPLGTRVLLARAAVARDVLPEKLAEMGVEVTVAEAYRTESGDTDGTELMARLAAREIDMVTFTSSSTVTNLLSLLGPGAQAALAGVKVACIGPITADTCLEHGIKPDIIAEEFTIAGLVEAIGGLYKEGQA